MKTVFRITMMMLITSSCLQAQKHEIFKESFDTEQLKTLVLDFNSSYVKIEQSDDNKIHFDYSIEFNNYSKKEIEKILNNITASAKLIDDKIEFVTNSESTLGDVVYTIESLFGITFEGDYINFKEETNRQFRQSKQYFLDINSSSRGNSLKEYLKNVRAFDGKKKKKKIKAKNIKSFKTNFIIKIPNTLNIRVMAVNSDMTFKLDIINQLNVNSRNTNLKFMDIKNSLNNLDIVNGNFRSNTLIGGSYKFTHVDKVQIAEISNLTIDSEFTTTKIGMIGKNAKIVDFNSKFWIHNFSKGFNNFSMNTEYSEINLFFPENMDYYIETFGHDTVHFHGNISTEIQPSRKNESSKMMLIGEETNPNKIKIKTIHGIVRFGEDFIDFGE